MRRLWWWLRMTAKDLCGTLHLNGILGMIEYCEDCGIRQPLVWWSPNDLWHELTGYGTPQGDNAAGILCPRCFNNRASEHGVLLQWKPSVMERQ